MVPDNVNGFFVASAGVAGALIGLLFVITNYALSRLSRRLEVRESRRTATVRPVTVAGAEDQPIAAGKL